MSLVPYLACFAVAFALMRHLFPYAHLLRTPLLCGAIFVSFPYLATQGPLKAFGHGMFAVRQWDVWQVTFAVLVTAAALLTTTDLVISYGAARVAGVPALPLFWGREIITRPIRLSLLTCVLGAAYFAGALYYLALLRPADGWGLQAILELALGMTAFASTLATIRVLTATGKPEQILSGVFRWMASPGGYIDPATDRPYPGHAISAVLAALSIAAYLIFGYVRYLAVKRDTIMAVADAEAGSTVPTLAWVVLLVLVYCWVFSGITFWLDPARIPVLLPVAILLALCGYFFTRSDHVYPVHPGQFDPGTPGELIGKHPPKADPDTIIAVAASGGGIQAAAWTATVVEGLTKALPGRFAPHVRVVSGVSGGSVGLMYFTACYRNGDIAHAELIRAVLGESGGTNPIFRLASAASLDYVAWGLAFPDFFRSWIPILFPQHVDRAWALSRAWLRYRGMEPLATATLGGWASDARSGARPAAVFNATLAETGARYLLSTFNLKTKLVGRRHFLDDLPGQDIEVATAARLSAAFPYVSPASRAEATCKGSPCGHLVDGGYYDNYGVASSIDFLLEALPSARGKRVLLIQIEVGPFGDKTVEKTQRGWFYQLMAPPEALLGVWSTGMRSRNEADVAMLREVIEHRGGYLTSLRVDFPDEQTPTSWYLTPEEKERIESVWRDDRGPAAVAAVRRFLEAGAH
ncbi:MAG: patatin-like phospholipase family protein [Bryobacteraceae bacterium]